jgi:tetratricopeptide (TPR) repeat protein
VSPSRARSAALAVLAIGYAAVWLPIERPTFNHRFDPLAPPARHVEQAIETGRFSDALQVALDLDEAFPNEPQILYWLAEIHHGLNQPAREASAWEAFISASPARATACPRWPEAYARAGRDADAMQAYERCVGFAPDDPERLIDLADALASHRLVDAARAAYTKAASLDRSDPRPALRLRALVAAAEDR